MSTIFQNTGFNQTFILVSSVDHISPLTGASPVVLISKAGGAFAAPEGNTTEIGDGWYNIQLTTDDTNTVGVLSFHITAAGADNTDFANQIIAALPAPIPPQPTPAAFGGATLAGFIEFINSQMQPPDPPFNPVTSPYVSYAFDFAIQWVNQDLSGVPNIAGWSLYAIAVYNLGADTLINITEDQPTDPIYKDGKQYWEYLRAKYKVLDFIPGLVQSSSDEGTSVGYMIPKGFENYTISNLQNLKTPYGRRYLGIAQSWGTLWGLS